MDTTATQGTSPGKRVLDVACGSKMFWFDKNNQAVEYCDRREVERHEYYPGRYLEIKPDTICDFTKLPFKDEAFKLVVFDPPHLTWAGDKSWTALKYGRLEGDWREMLRAGFSECFRVLDKDGVLILNGVRYKSRLEKSCHYPPILRCLGIEAVKHEYALALLYEAKGGKHKCLKKTSNDGCAKKWSAAEGCA